MLDNLNDTEKEQLKDKMTKEKRKSILTLLVMKRSRCKNMRKKERSSCMTTLMMMKKKR